MNPETLKEPPFLPLPASGPEAVNHVRDTVKEAAHRATETAKDLCHTVSSKADETLVRSREYVRQNPLPAVLGALALGAALGYMIVMTRRRKPTLRARFVDDPLHTARDAVYAVLAPVSQRLHHGYDSARNGAGKAIEKLQRIDPSHSVHSWADQIGRGASKLRFW